MTSTPVEVEEEEFTPSRRGFDYRRLIHTIIEKAWLVVLLVLAGLVWGLVYLRNTPKVYEAKITMEVDVQEQNIVNVQDIRPGNFQSLDQLRTIEQNLGNRSLMVRVARTADLAHNTAFLPPLEGGGTYSDEAIANILQGMVHPVVRRGTRLIDVMVRHTDPKVAELVANTIGGEYINQSIAKRASSSKDALEFLIGESERLKKRLQDSELAIQEYKESHKEGVSMDEKGSSAAAKLQEFNQKYTEVKGNRIRLETDYAQIQKIGDDVERLMTVGSVAYRPNIAQLRQQITELQAAINTLSLRYKDKHPKMLQARSQINELQNALKEAVQKLPPLLKTEYDNAVATEASFAKAYKEQEQTVLSVNKESIPFRELTREMETNRALYENVLKRVKETDLTKGIKADPVEVVETAVLPRSPVAPKPSRVMSLAIGGGLAAALGLIFLLNALDRTVKTVDVAEDTFGIPVLAAVSKMKVDPKTGYLLMNRKQDAVEAEAFRSLRASLAMLGPESERRVILFTSALPNEGKSFTCTNYAISLAQQGHRTLLIDGDLRRPSLHKIFGAEKTRVGLTEYLIGTADFTSACKPSEIEHLDLMSCGQKAPNPAELLLSDSLGKLLTDAMAHYERIIIDTAPVIAVSDTLLIVPHVQTLCLVVRAAKTPRNAVLRAIELLAKAGRSTSGLVLNYLPKKSGMSYYYYYGDAGYGKSSYATPAHEV